MKKIILSTLLLIAFTLNAQNYQFLGDYTSNGTPLYLEPVDDVVSVETLEMISNAIPENYPVPDFNPQYISSGYDTDVILEDQADVYVTFVAEGAGYRNVLGFYTYDVNNPPAETPSPEDITIIFPNVSALGSGGGLLTGNKVHIGNFPADTGIGWVLLANAWYNQTVTSGLWQLYSNPDYNPESDAALRNHNVLLEDEENERVILGFEDIRRDYSSCDNDFNDAVFYITASPYSAIKTTNFSTPDSGASTTTSGNAGGLESNGNLASLIAKRNLTRAKEDNLFDKKETQVPFSHVRSELTGTLDTYLPTTGMFGNEVAQYSTPIDLLDITNALEVLAVDYYQGEQRVSAVLGTVTEGSIYDHSKVICDRLNSSILEDVRSVMVRGHKLMSATIERSNGAVEHTVSFSIKLEDTSNELFSFWDIGRYPEGDFANFQIWGSTHSQVFHIANHIIDTYTAEKPLSSEILTDVVPTVFVKSGYYESGQLFLTIQNRLAHESIDFNGSKSTTELSDRVDLSQSIPLDQYFEQDIVVDTGKLFDIGFSIAPDDTSQIDAVYLADGPWGIDYVEDQVFIEEYIITSEDTTPVEGTHLVERNPSVQGQIKETLNLFRHLRPGDQVLDVSAYDALQFTSKHTKDIEVILLTDEEIPWENRWRYILPANSEETPYTISFTDFTNANEDIPTIENVRSVIFSMNGNYVSFEDFELNISYLTFGASETLATDTFDTVNTSLLNYPNPFTDSTTIQLPKEASTITITVYDMLGRVVDQQKIETQNNGKTVHYIAPRLVTGMYSYSIIDDHQEQFHGRFLIR